MPDVTNEPLMNLQLPTVSVRVGPLYAADVNGDLLKIAAHDHTASKGVRVPTAGLDINADLAFGDAATQYNATHLRSVRLDDQGSTLSAPGDDGCVYDVGGDLYWNNGAGVAVQITAGAALNAAALAPNVWPARTVSTNLIIGAADSQVVHDMDTSGGARSLTLPAANAVARARFYVVKDSTGSAAANPITLRAAGTDTIDGVSGSPATRICKTNRGVWFVYSDGVSDWRIIASSHELNGARVPAAGALTVGNVLQVGAADILTYGAVNLAGGAAFVSGVLPAAQVGPATTGQSGGVQLAHDLAGTATSPNVVGVSAIASNPFTLGSAGPSSISLGAADVRWPASTASPGLGILKRTTTGAPTAALLYGQDAFDGGGATAAKGGDVTFRSGQSFGAAGGDANVNGAAQLQMGLTNVRVGVVEVATSRATCALGGTPTTADLGANTGNITAWLREANAAPTAAPTTGVLLASVAGALQMQGSNASAARVTWTNTLSGAAGALSQYLIVKINGTDQKIPLYGM